MSTLYYTQFFILKVGELEFRLHCWLCWDKNKCLFCVLYNYNGALASMHTFVANTPFYITFPSIGLYIVLHVHTCQQSHEPDRKNPSQKLVFWGCSWSFPRWGLNVRMLVILMFLSMCTCKLCYILKVQDYVSWTVSSLYVCVYRLLVMLDCYY